MLMIQECYRRLFPVVRDANQLILTDGTNPMTITNTSIGGKMISNLLTSSSLSTCTDATITSPSNNQVLTYNGSKWVNTTQTTSYKRPVDVVQFVYSGNLVSNYFHCADLDRAIIVEQPIAT